MQTERLHTLLKKLGAHIQHRRKELGISQEQLGEIIGIDRVAIGYIEQGRRSPKLSTLFDIAQALDTEVSEFFKGLS